MKSKKCKKRGGFTLTELAIVLGIIGSITGAIWFAASNAGEAQKENNAVNELQTVAQNINNIYAGQSMNYPQLKDITQQMIAGQEIPSAYADANGTTADNPWSVGSSGIHAGLVVFGNSLSTKNYRITFYDTSYKGCMALLLQGTACQSGQVGCPVEVYTNNTTGVDSCQPGPNTNCHGVNTTVSGWQTMTVSVASQMCGDNPANLGSVEFDFSL